MTLIGNARHYGGGIFYVSPDAVLDDGQFEVLIFEGRTFANSVAGAWRLLRGRHRDHPGVTIRAARHITAASLDCLPLETDGEPLMAHLPLTITVAPRALRVLVPAHAPASLFAHPALVAPGDML